jgi:hypothetical protein
VQLLQLSFLNVFGTALVVCGGMALIGVMPLWAHPANDRRVLPSFLAILAFATLGFVTGDIMGSSRDSVVGEVLPAVLALLAGVAAYLVGSKGVEAQTSVATMVLSFAVTLFIGALFATQLRIEFESALSDPERVRQQELAAEQNRLAVEVQRLQNYITFLKLKQDFADQDKIDLSKFGSVLEIPAAPSK